MVKLVLRVVINAFAIWVAAQLVEGVELADDVLQILLVGLVFGLINAFIKPFLKLISAPIIILTLGLFTLLINMFLLWLTSLLTDALSVSGFFDILLASIIISVVSWLLNLLLAD